MNSEISTPTSSNPSSPHPSRPPPQPLHRPIDLNLKTEPADDEILPPVPPQSNPNSQTLAPDSAPNADSRVLEARDVKLESKDSDLNEKEVNFDIEEESTNEIPGMGLDAVIPGLSGAAPVRNTENNNPEGSRRDGGDDWDSDDSEDDLQIVLNDNNPMGMERGNGEEDDDDGLVIMAESELNHAGEEPEWGEEGQQAAEGERKETGEAGRGGGGGGGPMVAPKIGYSNHGYHPFHSQFKVSLAVLIY